MRIPNSATNKDASGRQDVDLRDLTRSMIRFTNAVTLFSIQRMQIALVSGVNYFFSLTTIISPDQRQLLFDS